MGGSADLKHLPSWGIGHGGASALGRQCGLGDHLRGASAVGAADSHASGVMERISYSQCPLPNAQFAHECPITDYPLSITKCI
ncbi:hypothetical protein PI95_031595 [Hassallia byssoidea VB512170]|uniref:Uncharacterized protein n=1 Tax=Hassallia byssoidea VB512170 TaxID=1304833 RepID=A0A846HKG9_9CYAN|nr:hypothetical protein [Hassalia byssoidea]NEU76920.1 hypothetical protein [Hassalia byssoidea VB512170]